jgi:hypothetical protein
MDFDQLGADAWKIAQDILGYLNFSSGASDPRFLRNLDQLFSRIDLLRSQATAESTEGAIFEPTWSATGQMLHTALDRLHGSSDAFRQIDQARAVLGLVFERALPAYREHQRDLLFHQTAESLFQPFFLGRVCEAILRQGGPWDQVQRIVDGALGVLNDFIGHRPVPVLRTEQKIQPYAQEWVRPIPLMISGAGVAQGKYHDLVAKALEILQSTAPTLLTHAWFNPEWLDELALDPRAYDFDHPVNKRPNYHFGQWDPHHIDNSGRYRRFVLQQVTLDAMLRRVEQRGSLPYAEVLYEAAAVLAGTILMASGISGSGPGVHDSTVTLATLLPQIAAYRDAFYEWLLGRMTGPHGQRLRDEAIAMRQPFGGARQHLNHELARRRAMQLQHTHLAQFFAWMGYTEAALTQSEIVPVASARMTCQIYCRLTAAHLAIDRGNLEQAAAELPEVEDLLQRAIHCGALLDPWNILGFGGQFSLFPAVENSVHDHRVDDLIELIRQIFALSTRLAKESAAAGNATLPVRVAESAQQLAQWWDKFASTEVEDVEGFSGREAWESAAHVASVLREWHAAGTSSGDLAFWRGHMDKFHSPKAYALVVESLLEQPDLVAAMALLIQWLSQAEEVPLADQDHSFHDLAIQWMQDLLEPHEAGQPAADQQGEAARQRWTLARKMLDYLEANADDYGHVPQLNLTGKPAADEKSDEPAKPAEDDGPEELFAAAYEDVTFRDSADDGFEGETLGWTAATEFELANEADRIADRLAFLSTLAELWKMVASALGARGNGQQDRQTVLAGWLAQANANSRQLAELLRVVDRYRIPPPRGTHESLIEYDRRSGIKESLLEQIIATCVETADAARSLSAAVEQIEPSGPLAPWEEPAQRVLRAIFRGDRPGVRQSWPELLSALAREPLLYVALAKGGNPQRIVASRNIQQVLHRLLAYLPRLGLLEETCQLITTIQDMERNHAVGPGGITEFDQLFEIACRGIVRSLIISSEKWHARGKSPAARHHRRADLELITHLERAVEALLQRWLDHSRGVRLSVLEAVNDEGRWNSLQQFIENYGHDFFTQQFMTLGNLRGILHQGAETYLRLLEEEPRAAEEYRLLGELDGPISRDEAVHWLSLAIEAVAENYGQYIDYNSTTTQSDRGEMLYTLLDFLRIQTSYNRVAWNLRPIILAHELLVRHGRDDAAEIWREAVVQRTSEIADGHLARFQRLCQQYGMRLPSIAEELEERFVRVLTIDRLRALVGPAIDELREGQPAKSFEALREGIRPLTEEPAGVGFEVPHWLEALEDEVEDLRADGGQDNLSMDPYLPVPEIRLSIKDVEQQIRRML